MSTAKYIATAAREGRWFVITVDGVGVTQSRTWRDAEEQARDLVAIVRDVPADEVEVEVVPALDDDVANELRESRQGAEQLRHLQESVATQSTRVAARLEGAGWSGADIAALLEVSPQRVSQLLAPNRLGAAGITRAKGGRITATEPGIAAGEVRVVSSGTKTYALRKVSSSKSSKRRG